MSSITYSGVPYSGTTFSMPTVARTRLRLTRRGRIVIAALVSVPLVLALLGIALNGGGAVAGSTAAPVTVTVQAGQSLWGLAEELAPGAPTADVVADLVAVNGLSGASVLPGQVLIVPAAYAD